jgi:enoyl-CoA hydratase/carnithine racemase
MAETYETLLYREDDGVAWVTMNRPEVHNSFNIQMMNELQRLWRGLRRNDEVRAVVLTGAGDEAFCTGMDRAESMNDFLPDYEGPKVRKIYGHVSTPLMFDDPGNYLCPKQCGLWKPVISAVNGIACAGAFYLLGESDIIIAAEHATFFDPHVTYGMVAAFESLHLMNKLPFPEMLRCALMGAHERISAQRAFQVGMVTEIVPLEKLHSAAGRVAHALASEPPLAVQATMRAVWAGLEHGRSQSVSEAYSFVGLGTERSNISDGQQTFVSGRRVEWQLR